MYIYKYDNQRAIHQRTRTDEKIKFEHFSTFELTKKQRCFASLLIVPWRSVNLALPLIIISTEETCKLLKNIVVIDASLTNGRCICQIFAHFTNLMKKYLLPSKNVLID